MVVAQAVEGAAVIGAHGGMIGGRLGDFVVVTFRVVEEGYPAGHIFEGGEGIVHVVHDLFGRHAQG